MCTLLRCFKSNTERERKRECAEIHQTGSAAKTTSRAYSSIPAPGGRSGQAASIRLQSSDRNSACTLCAMLPFSCCKITFSTATCSRTAKPADSGRQAGGHFLRDSKRTRKTWKCTKGERLPLAHQPAPEDRGEGRKRIGERSSCYCCVVHNQPVIRQSIGSTRAAEDPGTIILRARIDLSRAVVYTTPRLALDTRGRGCIRFIATRSGGLVGDPFSRARPKISGSISPPSAVKRPINHSTCPLKSL